MVANTQKATRINGEEEHIEHKFKKQFEGLVCLEVVGSLRAGDSFGGCVRWCSQWSLMRHASCSAFVAFARGFGR